MKRMIAFLFVIIFLAGFKIIYENTFPELKFEKLVVISQNPSLFDCETLRNGNDYYFYFNEKESQNALKNLNIENIEGLVYYFDKNINLEKIKNKLNFYYKGQSIDNMVVYYGYDSTYPDFRIIDGKRINVQIVKNSTNIIVGYPLILCGY